MTKDEIRMKLWCDVYAVMRAGEHLSIGDIEGHANTALKRFDKRFPAESSEPVDEPRRVWVVFNHKDDHRAVYDNQETAEKALSTTAYISAYAEFQQVGPMVRRDDV